MPQDTDQPQADDVWITVREDGGEFISQHLGGEPEFSQDEGLLQVNLTQLAQDLDALESYVNADYADARHNGNPATEQTSVLKSINVIWDYLSSIYQELS